MTRRVGVLDQHLLFELAVKELIALILCLFLRMELEGFLEALMNQKGVIEHLKSESCHVQLTSLLGKRRAK